MSRGISELLEYLLRFSDDLLRIMAHISKYISGTAIFKLLDLVLQRATSIDTLNAFLISFLIATLIVLFVFLIHVSISFLFKRKSKIFISYQHDHEDLADELINKINGFYTVAVKLPFIKNPDHNSLLTNIKREISSCDIFICLPGKNASFVENEVMMAFGLDKPILFIMTEAEYPYIPNTAKKGYPIFILNQLKMDGFRILTDFCSYLASNLHSTLMIYASIFKHIGNCIKLIILFYIYFILATRFIIDHKNENMPIILQHGFKLNNLSLILNDSRILTFITTNLMIFLIPYWSFFANRIFMRAKIRGTVTKINFNEEFLPKTLTYSLTRHKIKKNLFPQKVFAHYEVGNKA
jgi:hypothetical protein